MLSNKGFGSNVFKHQIWNVVTLQQVNNKQQLLRSWSKSAAFVRDSVWWYFTMGVKGGIIILYCSGWIHTYKQLTDTDVNSLCPYHTAAVMG